MMPDREDPPKKQRKKRKDKQKVLHLPKLKKCVNITL